MKPLFLPKRLPPTSVCTPADFNGRLSFVANEKRRSAVQTVNGTVET